MYKSLKRPSYIICSWEVCTSMPFSPKSLPLFHSELQHWNNCLVFSERKYIFNHQNWFVLTIIYLKCSEEGTNQAHLSNTLNYLNIKQMTILQIFFFLHYLILLWQSEVIESANYEINFPNCCAEQAENPSPLKWHECKHRRCQFLFLH